VLLMNSTGQIVVASHSTAVAGMAYNPSKIVSDVLTTGLSFTRRYDVSSLIIMQHTAYTRI
jgi:hypothetical protein